MVVDLRGHDPLIRVRLLQQLLQAIPHGIRTADDSVLLPAEDERFLHRIPEFVHAVYRRLQLPRTAAHKAKRLLLSGGGEPLRLLVGIGGHNVQSDHGIRLLKRLRRPEACAVQVQGREQIIRREMAGEGERQAEPGGKLGAEAA
ncbi:hypothetical protein D3C71_1644330 [compost metagenome]